MEPRIDMATVAPGAYKAMSDLEIYLRRCGLEESLLHLIKLRTSQINGCAYRLDMHWKDLKAIGESEQRLYSLDAWRETPFYSERERKLSPRSPKATCRRQFSKSCVRSFRRKRLLISPSQLQPLMRGIESVSRHESLRETYEPAKKKERQPAV